MKPLYIDVMPPKLVRGLKELGKNISYARRKRELTVEMMCERARVSKQTYLRLENGDPSVSLGAFAMCLFALGEENRLQEILDITTDETGLLNDLEKLPKRVRKPS